MVFLGLWVYRSEDPLSLTFFFHKTPEFVGADRVAFEPALFRIRRFGFHQQVVNCNVKRSVGIFHFFRSFLNKKFVNCYRIFSLLSVSNIFGAKGLTSRWSALVLVFVWRSLNSKYSTPSARSPRRKWTTIEIAMQCCWLVSFRSRLWLDERRFFTSEFRSFAFPIG